MLSDLTCNIDHTPRTVRTHGAVSHVAAPSSECVRGEISAAGQVRLAGRFATGMAAGDLLSTATSMCANARTDAANGEWLRTPKFDTYHHSQRWRPAA